MKNLIRPAALLLYVLTLLTGLLAGMLVAAWAGAGEGQGLAAGAIVVGYGVMTAGGALILALFAAATQPIPLLKKVNRIVLVTLVVLVLLAIWRSAERRSRETSATDPPAAPVLVSTTVSLPDQLPLGFGMFKPNLFDHPTLFFYNCPHSSKALHDHVPIDSLTIQTTEYGTWDVRSAPPWLWPEHLKLDYNLLYFRIVGLTQEAVQVIVNQQTGDTRCLDRRQGNMYYWPDFLLSVADVRPLDPTTNPCRIKPLDHASETRDQATTYRPIQVRGDWLQVEGTEAHDTVLSKGWLRWRRGEQLLVSWSLLS